MIEENNQENSGEAYVGHLFKKKTGSKTEPDTTGISMADHLELQKIVNQLVKLPEDLETAKPPVAPKITRITHHEISAMRVTQSNMPAMTVVKLDGTRSKTNGLLATFEAFLGLFGAGKKTRQENAVDKKSH